MDYTHFVPAVKKNTEFDKGFSRILIDDLSKRPEVPEKFFLSWDLETSGLNPEESFIVGVSFTFDGKVGYYLPIRHVEGKSLMSFCSSISRPFLPSSYLFITSCV